MTIESLAKKIEDFELVDPIPRSIVETVIDLHILIEGNEFDPDADRLYEVNTKKWEVALKKGIAIIHRYGAQIEPKTLERLQEEFYSFTNSDRYLVSRTSVSVARTVLDQAFDGLNGWRS